MTCLASPCLTAVMLAVQVAAGGEAPDLVWAPYVDPTRPPASEWSVAPEQGTERSPPRPLPPPPDAPVTPMLPPRSVYVKRPRAPQLPNLISMAGAPSLGQWVRGELAGLGFPFIALRFAVGLLPQLDLGIGFDTVYFVANQPMITARWCFVRSGGWSLAATLDAGYTFFAVRAAQEAKGGARWLTGRRNINLSPAVVVSHQGAHPRAVRPFLELRYLLALDTEPFATTPLAGVPPTLIVGHNGSLRGGAELPLSATTSFLVGVGLEFHGRPDDSAVMPSLALGLVTSL